MRTVLNSGSRPVLMHNSGLPRCLPLLALLTLLNGGISVPLGAQQKPAVPGKADSALMPKPAETPSGAASDEAWRQQSAQLLVLARQLKHEVDQTTENILSVKVIEKAKQIEQLTRAAQQELKAAN